jgi:ATP-dependent helicase/nuclease subunit A
MKEINWTKQQKKVIDTRGGNLLVSAGAGSGKTAVLVERIIQMITGGGKSKDENLLEPGEPSPWYGIDIDSLLVVTFTNAAAAEMRERISNALVKILDDEPGNRNIRKQLMLLGSASIMTIHSFCLKVIKNNINMLDIDPNIRIADEGEISIIKEEITESILEKRYKEFSENPDDSDNRNFIKLSEWINTPKSNNNLIKLILKIYNYSMSSPDPAGWLKNSTLNYNTDFGDFSESVWGKSILYNIKLQLKSIEKTIDEIIDDINTLDGYEKMTAVFEADKKIIEKLSQSLENWDILYEKIRGIQFARMVTLKKGIDKEGSAVPKERRNEYKKQINGFREMINQKSDEIRDVFKKLKPVLTELIKVITDFHSEFKDKKREMKIIDFHDIEHLCLELLSDNTDRGNKRSYIAKELAGKYVEILVDEYQDSNLVQETIINMISGHNREINNVFMVGDVKQSIYRFRMARPDLFLEKYRMYKDISDSVNGDGSSWFKTEVQVLNQEEPSPLTESSTLSGCFKINLYKNFRSSNEIITFINRLFENIMSTECGEVDYNESEKLLPGLGKCTGEVPKLVLLDKSKYKSKDMDSAVIEARYITGEIKKMTDAKAKKPVEYRDIVVLLRATRNWSSVFTEEFENAGIPVYADTSAGYFDTVEVGVFISLLKIIDNPKQDIPMLSVLRSSIGNFSDDELYKIRHYNMEALFYDNMVSMINDRDYRDINPGISKKLSYFLDKLNKWRKLSRKTETGSFIWYLLDDSGYYYSSGLLEGAEQRHANLRLLAFRANSFEKASLKGLFMFINYLERLKSRSQDYGSAKVLGEDENLVRIMSIHKSKGLEFPVVFLAGMGRKFNKQDIKDKIFLHQTLGIGSEYQINKNLVMQTPAKSAIKMLIGNENISEEMRVLYVALTRARERLYMVATINDMEKALENNNISTEKIKNAGSYLDWLLAIAQNSDSVQILESSDENVFEYEGNSDLQSCETDSNDYMDSSIKEDSEHYKIDTMKAVPQKISVTELKRIFGYQQNDEAVRPLIRNREYKKPDFMQEKEGLTGQEKGKALHYVLQHIDFELTHCIEDIDNQIKNMIIDEKLTEIQANSVNREKVLNFLESDIGKRARKSDKINRETPFIIKDNNINSIDVKGQNTGASSFMVQGIIDLYFEEGKDLILVDYKTDHITEKTVKQKNKEYSFQLDYYQKALESITGKKVKEKYIYYTYLNKSVLL